MYKRINICILVRTYTSYVHYSINIIRRILVFQIKRWLKFREVLHMSIHWFLDDQYHSKKLMKETKQFEESLRDCLDKTVWKNLILFWLPHDVEALAFHNGFKTQKDVNLSRIMQFFVFLLKIFGMALVFLFFKKPICK